MVHSYSSTMLVLHVTECSRHHARPDRPTLSHPISCLNSKQCQINYHGLSRNLQASRLLCMYTPHPPCQRHNQKSRSAMPMPWPGIALPPQRLGFTFASSQLILRTKPKPSLVPLNTNHTRRLDGPKHQPTATTVSESKFQYYFL
jgi:hypothetical protein